MSRADGARDRTGNRGSSGSAASSHRSDRCNNHQMFNAFLVQGEANFELRFAGFAMPVTWVRSADAAIAVVCMTLGVARARRDDRCGQDLEAEYMALPT